MGKRKSDSDSFKSRVALEAIQGDMTIAELASEFGLNPIRITRKKMTSKYPWRSGGLDGQLIYRASVVVHQVRMRQAE